MRGRERTTAGVMRERASPATTLANEASREAANNEREREKGEQLPKNQGRHCKRRERATPSANSISYTIEHHPHPGSDD